MHNQWRDKYIQWVTYSKNLLKMLWNTFWKYMALKGDEAPEELHTGEKQRHSKSFWILKNPTAHPWARRMGEKVMYKVLGKRTLTFIIMQFTADQEINHILLSSPRTRIYTLWKEGRYAARACGLFHLLCWSFWLFFWTVKGMIISPAVSACPIKLITESFGS